MRVWDRLFKLRSLLANLCKSYLESYICSSVPNINCGRQLMSFLVSCGCLLQSDQLSWYQSFNRNSLSSNSWASYVRRAPYSYSFVYETFILLNHAHSYIKLFRLILVRSYTGNHHKHARYRAYRFDHLSLEDHYIRHGYQFYQGVCKSCSLHF